MFQKVVLDSGIQHLANPKLEAVQASELVRKAALIPAVKTANSNFNLWKAHIDAKQLEAKNVLQLAEAKLQQMQQPGWIPNIYTIGEVKGAIDIINALSEGLRQKAEEYADAFAADGFRRNTFTGLITTSFPQIPAKDVEQFKSFIETARTKIISDQREMNAIRDRVKEYANRCEVIHDQAQAAHKKALGATVDIAAQLRKSIKDCQDHEAKTRESIRKVGNKLQAINDMLKKKKEGSTGNMIKGLLGERAENLKNASGGLKTYSITLDAAEKVCNGAPPLVLKEFMGEMVKLKHTESELQKQIEDFKTKAIVLQNKVIVGAGYKV